MELSNEMRAELLERRTECDPRTIVDRLPGKGAGIPGFMKPIDTDDLDMFNWRFWSAIIGLDISESWLGPWLVNPWGALEREAQRLIYLEIVSRIFGHEHGQKLIVTLRGGTDELRAGIIRNMLPDGGVDTFLFRRGMLNCKGTKRLAGKFLLAFHQFDQIQKDRDKACALKRLIDHSRLDIRNGIIETKQATIIGMVESGFQLEYENPLVYRFAYLDLLRLDYMNPAMILPYIIEHLIGTALEAYKANPNYLTDVRNSLFHRLHVTYGTKADTSVSNDGLLSRQPFTPAIH